MTQDQQTTGTDDAVPCPWCNAKQNLSELEIAVDSQVSCDDCGRLYAVTSIVPTVQCPKCQEPKAITLMELSENAVTHCPKCHRVFRTTEGTATTAVTLERA